MFRFKTAARGLTGLSDATLWGHDAEEGLWVFDPLTGEPEKLRDRSFLRFLDLLAEEARDTMPALEEEFGLSEPHRNWTLLPERQLCKFTLPGGRAWFARYSEIATWNERGHGWIWSWAEPAVPGSPDSLRLAARRVRIDGGDHGWRAATERCLLADDRYAWRLALLTAYLSDIPLVVRVPQEDGSIRFLALDLPVWAN